jgi:hypothetical protein
MMAVRRSATWFALAVAACAVSAFAQLNPTVTVLPKPQTPVPAECAEGLVAAPPRVAPEPQPTEPRRAPAPPSLDLKTRLRSVQVAAEQNDRDAFKAALADAQSAVSSYPAGGERNAANDVIGVYSDLERLWDYSFTSPSGAFFDSSTDFVSMMRRYPDYAKFIVGATLTVGGQTIYPTRETRQFLTAEASRRLARLGVRTPTRVTEEVPPPPKPRPQPQPKPKRTVAAPHVTKKPVQHKAATTPSHRKPTKIARATPTPPRPRVVAGAPPARKPARAPATTPQPRPTPAPVQAPVPRPVPAPVQAPVPRPAPVPAPVPHPVPAPVLAPVPQPPPAPEPQPIAQPAPAPLPVPQPTTTTASATTEATATTATAASTTTTTNNPPAQAPAGGRMNLLLAIILIIVGIGVLIVLFRASD